MRELSAFLGEEVAAFIYARRIDDGSVYFLPEDEGAIRRPFARAKLECLFPDCPRPRLTSAHRVKKRDGFVHRSGSNAAHPAEDSFHYQAQVRLLQWLEAKFRAPGYSTAMELQTDSARTRIADVMIERASDKQRVAFEVQYASLTPSDWAERHHSYMSMKIADVWIFGHRRAMKPRVNSEGGVKLNPTHEAVAETGAPVLWINPIEGTLAIAVVREVFAGVSYEMLAKEGEAELVFEPLSLFSLALGDDGWVVVTSPKLRRLRQSAAALVTARSEAAAAAAAALEVSAGQIRELARQAEEREAAAEKRRRSKTIWLSTDDGRELVSAFEGVLPPWIGIEIGDLPCAFRSSAEWQGTLYLKHLHGLDPGEVVRVVDCVRSLGLGGAAIPIVRAWFENLVRWGVVGYAHRGLDISYRIAPRASKKEQSELPHVFEVLTHVCSICGYQLAEIYYPAGRHEYCQVVKQRLRERAH
nr:competence protein CoiA family protein [Leifsonia psychrotolerans]